MSASYRDVSRRVGLSKDTVGRRIRVLCGAGVLIDWPAPGGDRFEVRRYLLRLDVAGIELDEARAPAVTTDRGSRANGVDSDASGQVDASGGARCWCRGRRVGCDENCDRWSGWSSRRSLWMPWSPTDG